MLAGENYRNAADAAIAAVHAHHRCRSWALQPIFCPCRESTQLWTDISTAGPRGLRMPGLRRQVGQQRVRRRLRVLPDLRLQVPPLLQVPRHDAAPHLHPDDVLSGLTASLVLRISKCCHKRIVAWLRYLELTIDELRTKPHGRAIRGASITGATSIHIPHLAARECVFTFLRFLDHGVQLIGAVPVRVVPKEC